MITVLQIAENIILLSFLGIVYLVVESSRSRFGEVPANLLNGVFFGLTAALVTVVPVTLGDGATVDARAGPVILAGIVAGPFGAIIAAGFGAAARGFVGGNFALSGVAVYGVYALIGLGLRHFRIVTVDMLPGFGAIGRTVLASMAGASSVFFLISPMERAMRWLQADLPLIFVANTMSVAYAAAAIGFVIIYKRKSDEVVRINEALGLAKRAGGFGIWDFDIESGRLVWDEVSMELHGIRSDSFEGTFDDWARNVHPDDLERTSRKFLDAMSGDAEAIFDAEYRVRLPGGGENLIKGDAIVIRGADGQPLRVVGSNIDLTAVRKTESQLAEAQSVAIQVQKMETVGQLTGGIAHDFNNLLAVIMGNLELLTMKLQDDGFSREEASKFIEDSLSAAQRGADLTQNMLSYARKAQLSPIALDLNLVVGQTEQWMRRTIESSVQIETAMDDDLWLTMADMSSMQSALVNLIVNARDAVKASGKISIETSNVVLDNTFRDHAGEAAEPGRYIMLAVSDDGVGMASAELKKIFDPFYTTKTVGHGTGLGLSVVQGFVKQSRGAIRVQSTPGRGTHFELYFPAISETSDAENSGQDQGVAAEPDADATARILLVEDQSDVRTVLRRMLESDGYEVVTAASGTEAFQLFQSDRRFDLVLTDIVMPGQLQGTSLASALVEQHPEMPFVFITGYDSDSNPGKWDLEHGAVRLMKPFSKQELLEAVRTSLAQGAI